MLHIVKQQFLRLVPSLHFVNSATSSAVTVTIPSDTIPGDIIVLWDKADNTIGDPGNVVPTNFTSISSQFTNNVRGTLTYKIAVAGDAGTSVTGMDGSSFEQKAMGVFRLSRPPATVTVNNVQAQITDGDPTAQAQNISSVAGPILLIGAYGSTGAVSPRTFSPAQDGEITPTTGLYLNYKIYNSNPADTSIDMDDEGNRNVLISCYFTFTF